MLISWSVYFWGIPLLLWQEECETTPTTLVVGGCDWLADSCVYVMSWAFVFSLLNGIHRGRCHHCHNYYSVVFGPAAVRLREHGIQLATLEIQESKKTQNV